MPSNKITEKHLPALNLMSAPNSMRNMLSSLDAGGLWFTRKIGTKMCMSRMRSTQSTRFKPGRSSVSVFVKKFVVEDGRCQLVRVFGFVNRILGTNQPSLTEDTTVLLSGDFLGHLEYQFHERIRRQLLRTVKQYA